MIANNNDSDYLMCEASSSSATSFDDIKDENYGTKNGCHVEVEMNYKSRDYATFRGILDRSDPEEKKTMIRDILISCDESALEYASKISQVLRENLVNCTRIDFLSALPNPISIKILCYLDPKSLCKCGLVCQAWKVLCNEWAIWKSLCLSRNAYRIDAYEEKQQVSNYRNLYGHLAWKKMFSERYRLCRNWLNGCCVVRTFAGHSQGISCVQFDENRIVSGSSDKTIRVWDLKSNTLTGIGTMTLTGHSNTVRCLHLSDNRLASGSNDNSIKVWDLAVNRTWSSIACRHTMLGHAGCVRCLQMDDDQLISGSYDCSIKKWSLTTGACVSTFSGHTGAVLCLQYNDGLIVSGSSDRSIKYWDARTGRCVMTLHNSHANAITCIRFDNERIISGSVDENIKIWDLKTGHSLQTLDWKVRNGHNGVVRNLQVDGWRLVSASDDRTVKVWDIHTGDRLCTLQSHSDGVTCVQFNDYQIVSGSYDKTVKLWDFRVS